MVRDSAKLRQKAGSFSTRKSFWLCHRATHCPTATQCAAAEDLIGLDSCLTAVEVCHLSIDIHHAKQFNIPQRTAISGQQK
jgi:hypothetical protein